MSGTTSAARLVLVFNERTKLLANALDRASTALGAGAFFPLYGVLKPVGSVFDDVTQRQYAFSVVLFLVVSIVLHLIARHVLGGLR